MLQRSYIICYIILIVGVVLLISGIIISAVWAGSFATKFMRENTLLNGVLIRPSDLVNTSFQVTDTSRPVSLAVHVERSSNNTSSAGQEGQISNNTLRETIRNPNGSVVVLVKESTLQLKGRHC